MTALVDVSGFVPEQRVSIEDLAGDFGLTPMQVKVFRRYHKIGESRRDPTGDLTGLLRHALTGLAGLPGNEHRVRFVLYARTFPTVVPYPLNPLHELCAEFNLGHAQAYTISHQACASGLAALDVAARLLAAEDTDALALVLTGEKTFTPEATLVPETSMFGEGSAACLIGDGDRDRLLSYAAQLRGEFDGDQEEVMFAFQREYPDSLADAVEAAVARAGLTLADVALILPHNVNAIAWQRVCRRIGYPLDQVMLDHVGTYGHVFCADAFLNYRTARQKGLLRLGDRYVIAAAGAGRGATFSAMVLQH
jgi:3-oxoacyl-[acyl-carrier-protein] synthase-3